MWQGLAEDHLTVLLAAPFIGSLLGVLIRRLPQAAPVMWARSACPDCRARLPPHDLVPVLSFLALRGRCRHCDGRIDRFHLWIELASVAVVIWAILAGRGPTMLTDCVLGWTLLALAWTDLETMLLPDALTLPLILAGLAEAWWFDPSMLWDRAIAAAVGWSAFAALAWLWRRLRGIDALGAGDAKLLAAGGAWIGLEPLPWVVLLAALIGIGVALIRHGRRLEARQQLAFGPWLALAIWLLWLYPGLLG